MAGPWEKYSNAAPAPDAGPWSKYGSGVAPMEGPNDASAALSDPEWAKKGRILFKENNRQDFKGSDAEAAKYLNDYLYDFNYRLVGAGADGARGTLDTAAKIAGYSDEGKKAFVDAQTQFENMNTTLGGVGEATKRVLTDPTNLLGIGTFGVGTVAGQGAKYAAKEGVKELAKVGAKRFATRGLVTGAAEGAAYGAVSDLGQQQAMVNAGGQESIDPMQTVKTAGLSAVAGGGLGAGAGAIAGGIAGRNPSVRAARQLVDDPQKALRGAEITQNISDVQATREVPMGLADVNQQADVLKTDIISQLNKLGLPNDKLNLYKQRLAKARGLTEAQVNELRGTPEGDVVAENIAVLKQMRDTVAPQASEGGIKRAIRVGLDYMPIPRVLGDAIKYAALKPRRSGEEMIAKSINPRNLKIAQEITRLGGQSDAAMGRQQLSSMADTVSKAREAVKTSVSSTRSLEDIVPGFKDLPAHLQQGLRVAAETKVRKELDLAAVAAEKLKIEEIKMRQANIRDAKKEMSFQETMNRQKERELRQNKQETRQELRFQEYQNRQKDRLETEAKKADQKQFSDNLARVNATMRTQQRFDAQRLREELAAQKAVDDAQREAAKTQTKAEQEFNKAVIQTNRLMKFREAMRKLKDKESLSQIKYSVGLPPHGQSIGMAPKAPRMAKAAAEKVKKSVKSEAKKAEASADAHIKSANSDQNYPAPPRNYIAYQGGTDLIVGYQNQAKDFANSTPDTKLGDLIRKSVEKFERTRGRARQADRMKIYREALEEAQKMGEEAFYNVDRYLEPLALVFEQPKGSN